MLGDLGIKLIVPSAVERIGDVQPPAVQAELEHLRAAGEFAAVNLPGLADQPADIDLPRSFGLNGSRDVVLPNVPLQPVGEIQESIVHRDDQIGDQPGHRFAVET